MKHDDVIALLKRHELRITPVRKECLRVLLNSRSALPHGDIEAALKDVDRITLYRTLRTFEDHGIIHHAVDADGQKKYALCSEQCNEHEHNDHHLHFHCQECGTTSCLDTPVPEGLHLPNGYEIESFQFNVIGKCPDCR